MKLTKYDNGNSKIGQVTCCKVRRYAQINIEDLQPLTMWNGYYLCTNTTDTVNNI